MYYKIMKRKVPLVNDEIYHVLSRSIAEYKIFNDKQDYQRMRQLLRFYQRETDIKFSDFIILEGVAKQGFDNYFEALTKDGDDLVEIIAFCIMPTHIHLILKQLQDDGISKYFGNILNSYTRYFNSKHKRKGPLWEAKFKNILVKNDEQLLHLTRYIHLNPVSASLVKKPEEWTYSSYKEYLGQEEKALCEYADLFEIKPSSYRKFVLDRAAYQRQLSKIKALLID